MSRSTKSKGEPMFRSRVVALALAACALIGHSVAAVISQPIAAVCRYIGFHVKEACAMASHVAEQKQTKPSILVKAAAFAASLVKRERPVLTASWRMCPSA